MNIDLWKPYRNGEVDCSEFLQTQLNLFYDQYIKPFAAARKYIAGPSIFRLPEGVFRCMRTIEVPEGMNLEGAGFDSTVIEFFDDTGGWKTKPGDEWYEIQAHGNDGKVIGKVAGLVFPGKTDRYNKRPGYRTIKDLTIWTRGDCIGLALFGHIQDLRISNIHFHGYGNRNDSCGIGRIHIPKNTEIEMKRAGYVMLGGDHFWTTNLDISRCMFEGFDVAMSLSGVGVGDCSHNQFYDNHYCVHAPNSQNLVIADNSWQLNRPGVGKTALYLRDNGKRIVKDRNLMGSPRDYPVIEDVKVHNYWRGKGVPANDWKIVGDL